MGISAIRVYVRNENLLNNIAISLGGFSPTAFKLFVFTFMFIRMDM